MSSMLESLSNPAQSDKLEERMAHIKEDPSLKPILEEIERGGPSAMMRSSIFIFIKIWHESTLFCFNVIEVLITVICN